MFPTIGDLINYFLGTHLIIPIQSFGFMMALAFLSAAFVLSLEMRRKEKDGLLHPVMRTIEIGKKATALELILNGVIGFIIGFKLVAFILNFSTASSDPQSFFLSTEGNWIGGIGFAIILMAAKYFEKDKQKLPEPKTETVLVHPYQLVGDITILAAISGLIGAKLFDTFEDLNTLRENFWGTLFSFSGLTFYGGLICAALVLMRYCRKNKFSIPVVADAVAPALILAYGVGRIGCQLAGDGDWGIVNQKPVPSWWFLPNWLWAFNYPHNVINEGIPLANCDGTHCMVLPFPVYPTPVYETAMALLIFAFLWMIRKRIKTAGVLFSIYLILNGIERFFIELIRVNSRYHFFGIEATQAELIALGLIILGIIGLFYFPKRAEKIRS
jgi:phosphatidylglycerol---prolipoprotein diacylglyceryl transferase